MAETSGAGPRIAVVQGGALSDELLSFAAQLGASGVVLNRAGPDREEGWGFLDLLQLRTRCEEYGLALEAIENVPLSFYDRVILGLPGRDEQIERYQEIIRNLGRAGIPILGFHWLANFVWRTSFAVRTRGGAVTNAFDLDLARSAPLTHGRVFSDEELWASYAYFIEAVVPVAEEAGVRLALHPDDPPVPSLGGIARIFRDFEGFKRGMEIAPSANLGLDFCVGSWSEMGPAVLEAIRWFGPQGKIFYVHFRDVQGHVPKFKECFLGEGNLDPVEVMGTLLATGFDGFIIDDHVPALVGDEGWSFRGRAFQTGYLMGLLDSSKAVLS